MVGRRRIKRRAGDLFKKRLKIFKRGIRILPHLFTLGNAFFGFLSIIFSAGSDFYSAAYCILFGALMDALDGRIARYMGVETLLGVELDSLSDAISFCLAPALLMYFWFLKKIRLLGILVCAFYLCCGLVRLARFNIIHGQQTLYFLGLPTTMAGCFLASFVLRFCSLTSNKMCSLVCFLLIFVLALLMVSRIPFPSFKHKPVALSAQWQRVAIVCLFALCAVLQFHTLLFLFFIVYFFYAAYYSLYGCYKKAKAC